MVTMMRVMMGKGFFFLPGTEFLASLIEAGLNGAVAIDFVRC